MNKMTDHVIPVWNPYLPKGASPVRAPAPAAASATARGIPRKVVYLPSCVTRMMGPSVSDYEQASVHDKLLSLFEKAGYEVIIPKELSSQCCGMMFNTRGLKDAAAMKGAQLEAALMEASEGGKIPICCDTSPCLSQIKASISEPGLRFALYEPVEFIRQFLVDKLEFNKVSDSQVPFLSFTIFLLPYLFLSDIFIGHFYRTFLSDIFIGHLRVQPLLLKLKEYCKAGMGLGGVRI
jgi:D-lactate dehydrogenase